MVDLNTCPIKKNILQVTRVEKKAVTQQLRDLNCLKVSSSSLEKLKHLVKLDIMFCVLKEEF